MSLHPHTPGPWSIDENVIYADVGPSICTVMDADAFLCLEEGTEDDVQAECNANARLIAAAPDMIDALRPFVAYLAARDENDADMPDEVTIIAYVPGFREEGVKITFGQLRAARAAIAKAEGAS